MKTFYSKRKQYKKARFRKQFARYFKTLKMDRCENCSHAVKDEIDGLYTCEVDGRSKDFDMVCEHYQ